MFILYAIPIGILAGYLAGGRLDRLSTVRLRWIPLILAGLAAQVALFAGPVGPAIGPAAPAVYVASTAAVLAAVLRNVDIPGVWVVALGAIANLAAIVANGGWMPADPAALASIGAVIDGSSNSIVVARPALEPLTDQFALPAWLPLANVFSVGDVLIGLGVGATIVLAMRRPSPATRPGDGA